MIKSAAVFSVALFWCLGTAVQVLLCVAVCCCVLLWHSNIQSLFANDPRHFIQRQTLASLDGSFFIMVLPRS